MTRSAEREPLGQLAICSACLFVNAQSPTLLSFEFKLFIKIYNHPVALYIKSMWLWLVAINGHVTGRAGDGHFNALQLFRQLYLAP